LSAAWRIATLAPLATVRIGLKWFERAAWIAGLVGVSIWAGAAYLRHAASTRELQTFVAARDVARPRAIAFGAPDTTLWDPKRVAAWQETQHANASAPLAVLRIPRVGIEAPVLEGTDDMTLNRGVGHIEDTAVPGASGNIGLAGHRDGFFRALKDIAPGDALDVETTAGLTHYRVERTWIVDPDNVSVLDPTTTPSVTLVTCYPFYFVGSAPERFIVRAVRDDAAPVREAKR
jgi:LPXTG-site transpeptidase (sortase) family protein